MGVGAVVVGGGAAGGGGGQKSAAVAAVVMSASAREVAAGRVDVSRDGWSGVANGGNCAVGLLGKCMRVCLCFAIAELGLG